MLSLALEKKTLFIHIFLKRIQIFFFMSIYMRFHSNFKQIICITNVTNVLKYIA